MKRDLYESLKEKSAPVAFRKTLGLFGATTLGVGGLMGAGLYVLVGIAADAAGPAVWFSYALCGALTALTLFLYSELARRKPVSGGGYHYAYDTLGSFGGFIMGWHLALGSIFACALYAQGFAAYALSLIPGAPVSDEITRGLGALLIIALSVFSFTFGKSGAGVLMVLTFGNVLILLALSAMGFAHFDADHFTPHLPNGFAGATSAISLIYISFFGFQMVCNSAEEVENPSRNVPRAMVLSFVVATTVYMLVVISAVGAVGTAALSASETPLVLIAQTGIGPLGGVLITIGGLLASGGALYSTLTGQGRQIFAMGRDGLLPRTLSAVTRSERLPAVALMIGGILAAMAVISFNPVFVAKAANFALLFSMLPVSLALHQVYQREKMPVSNWRRYIPHAALLANLAMIVTLDLQSLMFGGILIGAGLGVFLAWSRSAEERGRQGFSVSLGERSDRFSLLSRGDRILLPIGNPRTIDSLFTISRALLRPGEGEIVPLSIALSTADNSPQEVLQDKGSTATAVSEVEYVTALASASGTVIRPVVRGAISLASGIAHAAIEERCNLIVMGWTSTDKGGPSALLQEVVASTSTDFVFLHMREDRPLKRIGVAMGSFDNLALMTRVAGLLAEQSNGEVMYFNVIPEHFTADDLDHARSLQTAAIAQHAGLSTFRTEVHPSANPFEAIIEKSASLDLLLIGSAPSSGDQADDILGAFSTLIVEQAKCSAIIVRRSPGLWGNIPSRLRDRFTL